MFALRVAPIAMCASRPMLQEIKERWPDPGNHKVRLPGGRYVKPGFSQQCKLYDAIGGQVAENRRDAARALLTMQTKSSIVPASPPDPAPDPEKRWATRQLPEGLAPKKKEHDQPRSFSHRPDARQQQKDHSHHWFQFTPGRLQPGTMNDTR